MASTGPPDHQSLARCVQAVLALRKDLDAVSIAEALWLAASGTGAQSDGQAPPLPPPDERAEPETLSPEPEGDGSVPARATRSPARRPARPGAGAVVPGRLVQVGPGAPLPRRLRLERSLRPFKRHWQRGKRVRLDLDATVHAYTRTGQLVPVFQPAPERWFDVAVVRDDAPSMAIWAAESAGVSRVMRQAGTFKTVRDFRLSLSGPDGSAGPSVGLSSEAHRPVRPGKLLAPDGRQLIIIVTDGVAPGWRRPEVWQTIRTWAASTPTVLVSPLSARLWEQTGLDLPTVHVGPGSPGSPNALLKFTVPFFLREPDQRSGSWLPVPALSLDPNRVRSWARTLMRGDPAGCDALLVPPTGRVEDDGDDLELAVDANSVDAFLRLASGPAARLALLCSPFKTLSLPLLHLVRGDLVPAATTEHIAEALLSGLFHPPEAGADGPRFAFRDEARTALQERLAESDLWRVYDVLRNHIDGGGAGTGAFTAAVRDPAGGVAVPAGTGAGLDGAARDLLEILDVLPDGVPVIEAESAAETAAGSADGRGTGTMDVPDGELTDGAGSPILDGADNPLFDGTGGRVFTEADRLSASGDAPPGGIGVSGAALGAGDIQVGEHSQVFNYYYPSQRQPPPVVVTGEIPQETAGFQPREDIRASLSAGQDVLVVRALIGMRGVGKSQLAAAYARERIREGWRLVAWIDASDPAHLLTGLADVAETLGLGPSPTAEAAARQLRNWLESDGERCLVVFDNLLDPDVLRPYLPAAGRACVLITTSNATAGFLGRAVPVDVFAPAEAVRFLSERSGQDDPEGASAVAQELGYLPLALAQAAAVIRAQRLTYRHYLARLRTLPVERYLRPIKGDSYPRAFSESVLLSLEAVAAGSEGELCTALLRIIALLAESGVARSTLRGAAGTLSGLLPGHVVTEDLVDEAIGLLAEASLLAFSLDDRRVCAHVLIMRVVRESLGRSDDLLTTITAAAGLLATQADELRGQHDRAAMRELAEQVTALAEHTRGSYETDTGLTERMVALRSWALYYLNVLGDNWAQAMAAGESLCADLARLRGPQHPDTLSAMTGLANAYLAAGRVHEAAELQSAAVAGFQQILGPEHPGTIQALSNLAVAYQASGRFDEARSLLEQALGAAGRVLGPDHPLTLATRNNLARAYQGAGRPVDALPLLEATVAASERVLGPEHPDTLIALNNLAVAYQAVGQSDNALSMFERTLADRERVLGPDHPDTLASRNNLAKALYERGQPAQALALLEQTLTARLQLLGPDHPDTLDTLNNLAIVQQTQGRTAEAIDLLQEALAGSQRLLGEDHPSTMITRNNLAEALRTAGRPWEAVPLLSHSLAGLERALGPDHPSTKIVRENLASAITDAGQRSADS